MISILQLGTVDYATGLRLQQQLVDLRKQDKIGDVLLLLEHTPVITLGRNAKTANVIVSPEFLKQRGVELFESDRGGDVTFHGPGQIVGYPIFDLRGFARAGAHEIGDGYAGTTAPGRPVEQSSTVRSHLGAVDFVRHIEEVLMRTCADFTIPTQRIRGLTGVWTGVGLKGHDFSRAENKLQDKAASTAVAGVGKLAAIGVHISRFVTSHGFALNVNTDLSYFNLIIPCGITSKPVTSMQRELGRTLNLSDVAESISRHFGVVFQTPILWLESLDALLCGASISARGQDGSRP